MGSPKDMKTERISDSEDHITKEAVSHSTASLINADSVLIVTRSGILRHTLPVAVNSVPVTINQDLKALTPRSGIMAEYVAWALRAFGRDILNMCSKHGTTVNSVETSKLLSFQMPVAPTEQQHRIVAEIEKQFSRLDEAVANLRRVKANLKRYRASVLKAAVEGKLTEEWRKQHPDVEPASKLLERILTERRAGWNGQSTYSALSRVDSTKQPPLPEGWTWATVAQLTPAGRPCAYGVLQPGEHVEDGIPLVRVGDINDGRVSESGLKRISPKIAEQYPKTKLQGGEVAISLVGAIGRTAVIPQTLIGANTARAVGIIPLTTRVSAHWVEIWFRNPAKVAEILQSHTRLHARL